MSDLLFSSLIAGSSASQFAHVPATFRPHPIAPGSCPGSASRERGREHKCTVMDYGTAHAVTHRAQATSTQPVLYAPVHGPCEPRALAVDRRDVAATLVRPAAVPAGVAKSTTELGHTIQACPRRLSRDERRRTISHLNHQLPDHPPSNHQPPDHQTSDQCQYQCQHQSVATRGPSRGVRGARRLAARPQRAHWRACCRARCGAESCGLADRCAVPQTFEPT